MLLAAAGLHGCAAPSADLPPADPGPRPVLAPAGPRASRPGAVLAAPDAPSGPLAAEIARRTGFALVVGPGDGGAQVLPAAGGRLVFYAEIRGDDRADAAGRLALLAAGVDASDAARWRTLLELIRDAHLRARPGAPRLEVVVEAAGRGADVPGAARAERAVRVDVPRAARSGWRDVYAAILADFLVQALDLRLAR